MTRPIIYTVDADNRLTAMNPAAPENEDAMQRLIADYPEIIADADGALLLIRREQPIADAEGARWSLDHLFVTRGGVPVLVEMKRASDTRLRREVVGQMLDYAANATAHWRAGTIAASFAATAATQGRDADQVLADFLGDAADPDAFWPQVDANFAAGRIKLVFVADAIPRELARIVEFLNEQMKADVRAVELSWFEGRGVRAFTPRVIGETERAQAAKGGGSATIPLSSEEWIAARFAGHDDAARAGAARFAEIVEAAGWSLELPATQGSLSAVLARPGGKLNAFGLQPLKHGSVVFKLGDLKARPGFDEEVRAALLEVASRTIAPLPGDRAGAYPTFPAAVLTGDAAGSAFRALLDRIAEIGDRAARTGATPPARG